MGYSYEATGRKRLCCDSCGKAGGVRKRRCPFGWCQPAALCKECYAKEKAAGHWTKDAHAKCELHSIRFHADERKREALLANGKAVRCSALKDTAHRVHVLFRIYDGTTIGYYMAPETYRAIPLATPATVEDYAKHGTLADAPSTFHNGATTKQV